MRDSLGMYISVPFCRAKCTYCNFASGVFAADRMQAYVDRLCAEMHAARKDAAALGVSLATRVDSIFLGGGTPSLLEAAPIRQMFDAVHECFAVETAAEITLECAPGQLAEATLEELLRCGVNRVSFGVQSFVDAESRAVGRLHTRAMCLEEIVRIRASGIANLNVDLIAGLPHQTEASWRESLTVAIDSGVPHMSVYMLEVDDESRLGREVLAAGERYGADAVASEDESAERYERGCETLKAAGLEQYEISNFARAGFASRHNVKYWRRQPYLGFGLDAHSMLPTGLGTRAVRWANTSDMDRYLAAGGPFPMHIDAAREVNAIAPAQVFEEAMFLGLRMNEGVSPDALRAEFGNAPVDAAMLSMQDVLQAGLLQCEDGRLRLTARGRMASNEVFSRLLIADAPTVVPHEFVECISA